MILDADADTSITADTDDQIDVKIAGSDNIKITASAFEIGTTAPKINLKNTDTSIVADQSLGVIEVESSDGSTGSAGTIAKLDIAASGAFDGSGHGSEFRFTTGATNQSGSIALSEVMRISSTGKTSFSANGIGSTATQDRDFTFYSEGSTNGVDIRSNDYRLALIGAGGSSGSAMDKGYMALYNEGTNTVALNTNGDSYFNGGNVHIGTTSGTNRLTVVQPNNDYPVARFDMTAAVNAIVGMQIRVTDGTSNASNKFFIRGMDNTNVDRFILTTNGGLTNYQAQNSNFSDERLKENIEDVGDCLDLINKLQVKTFRYKDQHDHDTKIHTGLIAQEVEQIDPSLINQTSNEFGESPEGEEPYKAIYTTDLMHKMLKAIQEQQTQIEALQSEINTLKGE